MNTEQATFEQSGRAVVEPLARLLRPLSYAAAERVVLQAGSVLSDSQLRSLLGLVLGDLRVALCLHRVRLRATAQTLSIAPDQLDRLIELLRASRALQDTPWLTVSFDDGYDDAAAYVASRAPMYSDVEWLLFVCPERSEKGIAFSWDERQGELTSVSTLQRLAQMPNVALGNHTNSHHKQTALSRREAEVEYQRSFERFSRLFGPQHHFAFPFGTPEHEFTAMHVGALRRISDWTLWSTERRPHAASERKPGAVLPRFPINGAWSYKQIALWMCVLTLRFRSFDTKFHY